MLASVSLRGLEQRGPQLPRSIARLQSELSFFKYCIFFPAQSLLLYNHMTIIIHVCLATEEFSKYFITLSHALKKILPPRNYFYSLSYFLQIKVCVSDKITDKLKINEQVLSPQPLIVEATFLSYC